MITRRVELTEFRLPALPPSEATPIRNHTDGALGALKRELIALVVCGTAGVGLGLVIVGIVSFIRAVSP